MARYTDHIEDMYWSYAKRTADEAKDRLEDMEETATTGDWIATLERIKEEYTCSARLFLMRYLYGAGDRIAAVIAEEEETYQVRYSGRTYRFHKVSASHAFHLPDEERNVYIELLTRIAADRHKDPLKVWRPLMRKALLRDKKLKTLSRQEGFQIAHGLGFDLEKAEEFLLRVLENDGFCYTRSEDVIEAFCFLYEPANNWHTAQQIKKDYHGQADRLSKLEVSVKPDAFTKKTAQDLPALIAKWCADKEGDVVGRFMAWLLLQAPILDIPSRSAYRIYRRAAALAHRAVRILSAAIEDDPLDRLFGLGWEEEGEEDPYITDGVRRYCFQEGDALGGEDHYKVASDLLRAAGLGYDDPRRREPDRLWRYLTVDEKGRLTARAIGHRIPLLLSGEEAVTKADLLFLLWYICELLWTAGGRDTECFLYERITGFWFLAEQLLEAAMLPELYVPHLLERSFLYAICVETREKGSPFEIYEEMCESVLPEKRRRNRVKKVDPAETRRYHAMLKKKVEKLYCAGRIDLEGLGRALLRHYQEYGRAGWQYRFTKEGIYYQERKAAVRDPKAEAAILYPKKDTGAYFDKERSDYKEQKCRDERFQLLYGLVLYMEEQAEGVCRGDLRIDHHDKALITILRL